MCTFSFTSDCPFSCSRAFLCSTCLTTLIFRLLTIVIQKIVTWPFVMVLICISPMKTSLIKLSSFHMFLGRNGIQNICWPHVMVSQEGCHEYQYYLQLLFFILYELHIHMPCYISTGLSFYRGVEYFTCSKIVLPNRTFCDAENVLSTLQYCIWLLWTWNVASVTDKQNCM